MIISKPFLCFVCILICDMKYCLAETTIVFLHRHNMKLTEKIHLLKLYVHFTGLQQYPTERNKKHDQIIIFPPPNFRDGFTILSVGFSLTLLYIHSLPSEFNKLTGNSSEKITFFQSLCLLVSFRLDSLTLPYNPTL